MCVVLTGSDMWCCCLRSHPTWYVLYELVPLLPPPVNGITTQLHQSIPKSPDMIFNTVGSRGTKESSLM